MQKNLAENPNPNQSPYFRHVWT